MFESLFKMENEKDMLMGNIARIMVSNDIKEIERMRGWAHKRIDNLADYKIEKINNLKGGI